MKEKLNRTVVENLYYTSILGLIKGWEIIEQFLNLLSLRQTPKQYLEIFGPLCSLSAYESLHKKSIWVTFEPIWTPNFMQNIWNNKWITRITTEKELCNSNSRYQFPIKRIIQDIYLNRKLRKRFLCRWRDHKRNVFQNGKCKPHWRKCQCNLGHP